MIVLKILLALIAAVIAIVLIWFAVLFISGIPIEKGKEYDTNSRYYRFLLNFTTRIGLKIMRVRTSVSGTELLPKDTRFLLASNHRSNFDPLITWDALAKYDLAFISKPENFSIIFFGKIIQKCCFMSIDRKDSARANVTKERAARLLRSGEVSVAVYPEGTRSRTGDTLPFHNGLFNIAKEADVPIAVMTLKGTRQVKDNYPWHRSDVELDIIDVIPVEEVRALSPHDLGVRVREVMIAKLGS